jgi:shikimate kinase
MPGLAARIIATAEAEGIHRRQVENEELKDARFALTETFNVKKRGQWFGFAIAMSGIAGAIGLGFAGHTVACVGVCGAALAGLVSAFVGDKRSP